MGRRRVARCATAGRTPSVRLAHEVGIFLPNPLDPNIFSVILNLSSVSRTCPASRKPLGEVAGKLGMVGPADVVGGRHALGSPGMSVGWKKQWKAQIR